MANVKLRTTTKQWLLWLNKSSSLHYISFKRFPLQRLGYQFSGRQDHRVCTDY